VRLRDVDVPPGDFEHIARDAMGDFYLRQNARKVKDPAETSICSTKCGDRPRLIFSRAGGFLRRRLPPNAPLEIHQR
jgi:hypothetical protein